MPAPDVAESDTLAQSVMAWARDAMANYKVPRQVVLVDALPLNAGGKVLKRDPRRRHAAGQDHVVPYERSSETRGIVYTGEGVEVTDAVEARAPGPKEVRIEMVAAGVCHSDLSVIDGTIPFSGPGAGSATKCWGVRGGVRSVRKSPRSSRATTW